MSHVVLASSPLVGPDAMVGVAESLEAGGFDVTVPAVPGDLGGFISSVAGSVERESALVGFSAAGPRLFAVAEVARPSAIVFLDARLPADRVAPDDDARFAELLDALAADDGLLPVWPDWWPPDVIASLLPDAGVRAAFRSACPRLHRSMFSTPVPAPPYSGPCGFVGFGAGYADDAAESRRRGWPTTMIDGAHHLWPVVEPEESASAVAGTIRRLHP